MWLTPRESQSQICADLYEPLAHQVQDRRCAPCVHNVNFVHMSTISRRISSREFRAEFSDVVGHVAYGGERVALTRNGKVAAVLISKGDLETLESLEMAADIEAYRAAKATDDGGRVSLEELDRKLG